MTAICDQGGPGDTDGLVARSASVASLGYDGKWVVHPGQIDEATRKLALLAAARGRAAGLRRTNQLAQPS